MNMHNFKPPCTRCEQYKMCDSGTHRFFVVVVLLFVFISCGYSYFNSQARINEIRTQFQREMTETLRFKTDLAYTTIQDIGRYEGKASELMAIKLADRIKNDYGKDLPILLDKFKAGKYSDPRFNQIVYDVVTNSNDMAVNPEVYHSGYMLFVKDQMLHNNLMSEGSFAFKMDTFADKSYNQFLGIDFINMVREHRTETMLIEPRRASWVDTHEIIHSMSYNNLYNIIKNEGLNGLSGYYVLRPAYITQHGDIFNINDFDDTSGTMNDNFKITVVPYMSLYEYLSTFRKRSVDAIKVIEEEARKRATTEERNAYYSSIGTLILYIGAIFLLLNLSNCLFYRNLVKHNDVDSMKAKLTDRV